MQHEETVDVGALADAGEQEVATAKARKLEIPNRRAFEPIGQGGAGIRLEWHRNGSDLHSSRPVVVV